MKKILARALALALAAGLFALGTPPQVKAGPGGCGRSDTLTPYAFEEIDVSSTAKTLTQATVFPDGLTGGVLAVCFVEDDAIRYRADGLAPTASVGILTAVNTSFTVCGANSLKKFRMIRVTTDADVSCMYYREGDQ